MIEKEELREELEQELQRVKYRQSVLDLIEDKLRDMKWLAEQAAVEDITPEEREAVNKKLSSMAEQGA
ncbi:hypothetical protein EAL2_c03400 [Peptoclostridium acidaminophilum DSM 3953]|uniref:Uncharacterized protein n=1 Tax=Peptoclostridium acidaminophilum DSM 3953 TaxID=1286171 RepID=W8TCW8_PEPAC|nr:hypothetical protein [Peptoclostridium acidaminophilum]AHM55643.1 hypothetical protein EAL2_c03400 [Peptoclostridium acidaminophilum DSM 3953]